MKESKINKHIHVACAIIERDGLVLAARRNESMNMPLKWEFPGGKIDPGESPCECVHRELLEEMAVTVKVTAALPTHTHHYADFSVTLYPFVCAIAAGEIVLREHAAMVWLAPEKLASLDWAEADYPIINFYIARHRSPNLPPSGQV